MTDQPDYTVLKLIGALGLIEIGILYVLIALEHPLSPLIQRALVNPFGVFSLVMSVVTLLCLGMSVALTLRERAIRRTGPDSAE